MGFNPTLESSVQPMSPVERASPIQGVADLFNLFAPQPKAASQPSASDMKDQAGRTFFGEMDKAAQLRADGREAEATAAARGAYRSLTRQYGPDQIPGASELFTQFTGQDSGMALTGNTNLSESLRTNPEYVKNLALLRESSPDMSEADLDAQAMRITQNWISNDQQLAQFKQGEAVSWIKAKPVYDEGIKLAREDLQRMVATANKDSIISVEEAGQIRNYWSSVLNKFQPPPGVPTEEWDKYKSTYIDPMEEVINFGLEGILKVDASQDLPRALNKIVDVLIARGELPPALRINMLPSGSDPMASLQTALSMLKKSDENGDWATQIDSVMNMSYNELLQFAQNFEVTGPEWVEKINPSAISGMSMEDKKGTLLQDKLRSQSSDPGKAAEGIISLIEHSGAIDAGTYFDSGFAASLFDQKLFDKIAELEEINPESGKYIRERVNQVLDTRLEASSNYINQVAKQNGFVIQDNGFGTKQLVLSRDAMSEQQKADLDKYFGGSIAAATAAKGFAITYGADGVSQKYTSIAQGFAELPKIAAELKNYAAIDNMRREKFGVQEAAQDTSVTPTGMEYALPEEVAKDTAFVSAIKGVAQNNSIQPDWLARVIAFETANTWSPSVRNPGSTATGLIQFIESTAKSLGTSTEALSTMSRDEQMVYVDKYLQQYKGKIKNFGDLYMAIHYPKGIGQDDTYVMYSEGSAEYAGNRNLDSNGDGTVTRAEAVQNVISRTPSKGAVLRVAGQSGYDVGGMQTPAQPQVAPPVGIITEPATLPGNIVTRGPNGPVEAPSTIPAPEQGMGGTLQEKGTPAKSTNKEIQSYLDSLIGKEGGIQSFASEAELQVAIASGQVESGDLVAINGKIRTVE